LGRFTGIAPAPEGRINPIAEFGSFICDLDFQANRTQDQARPLERDRKNRRSTTDPSFGVLGNPAGGCALRIGKVQSPSCRNDLRVIDQPLDGFGISAFKRAKNEPIGFETGAIVVWDQVVGAGG
jgi:hypothetical protein